MKLFKNPLKKYSPLIPFFTRYQRDLVFKSTIKRPAPKLTMSPFLNMYKAEFSSLTSIFQRVTAFSMIGFCIISLLNFNSLFVVDATSYITIIQVYFSNFYFNEYLTACFYIFIIMALYHIVNGNSRFLTIANFRQIEHLKINLKQNMFIISTFNALIFTFCLSLIIIINIIILTPELKHEIFISIINTCTINEDILTGFPPALIEELKLHLSYHEEYLPKHDVLLVHLMYMLLDDMARLVAGIQPYFSDKITFFHDYIHNYINQ